MKRVRSAGLALAALAAFCGVSLSVDVVQAQTTAELNTDVQGACIALFDDNRDKAKGVTRETHLIACGCVVKELRGRGLTNQQMGLILAVFQNNRSKFSELASGLGEAKAGVAVGAAKAAVVKCDPTE